MAPGNKGLKLPAEIVPQAEVESLLASFGSSAVDVRNHAIVSLAYRAGLKIGEICALERRHWKTGGTLVVPARARTPQREIPLDLGTREALDRWMVIRKRLGVSATAPLFCAIAHGSSGNRILGSYVREMLKDKARALGIDRRVTAEGLRHSGKQHREHAQWRMESHIGRYLDEDFFRAAHPDAYVRWRVALDLYAAHPARHATAIGQACRDALAQYADSALAGRRIKSPVRSGTVDKLRALIKAAVPTGRISDHAEALIAYWGAVSDLAQRQAHGAMREKETLRAEDARRLIFHTMLVMFEVEQVTRG
jgi:Phage integrase family